MEVNPGEQEQPQKERSLGRGLDSVGLERTAGWKGGEEGRRGLFCVGSRWGQFL